MAAWHDEHEVERAVDTPITGRPQFQSIFLVGWPFIFNSDCVKSASD